MEYLCIIWRKATIKCQECAVKVPKTRPAGLHNYNIQQRV